MERIFLLNLGSTSLKFKLYEFEESENVIASGEFERIGGASGLWKIETSSQRLEGEASFPSHEAAYEFCKETLCSQGILTSFSSLSAIGYKAVHAGRLTGTRYVTENLLDEMERFSSFAPAHNPLYLGMMRLIRRKYPDIIQAARFETSFHRTIPPERSVYGAPLDWVEKFGIRRYGFHGSSHEYIAWRMRELSPNSRRVISIHLGGSSSLCAILDGKSIACSMGATPQSGLFQNNRVGDFDVFCLPALTEAYGGLQNVLSALSSQSGFLGISGVSNDLREILEAEKEGNARAKLALKAFADQIAGYIGMFTAYLGGLDTLVFTGGIGLHSGKVRSLVCGKLGFLPLILDENRTDGGDGMLSAPESKVQVWALKTDEELIVARHVRALLRGEEPDGDEYGACI